MVELSTYGSGEGAGWVTGRRYSTPLGRSMKTFGTQYERSMKLMIKARDELNRGCSKDGIL
jgi:hypothetical protein